MASRVKFTAFLCHSPAAPIPDNTVTSLRRRLNVMKEVFGDSDDDGAAGGGGGDDARRKERFKYDVHNFLAPTPPGSPLLCIEN